MPCFSTCTFSNLDHARRLALVAYILQSDELATPDQHVLQVRMVKAFVRDIELLALFADGD